MSLPTIAHLLPGAACVLSWWGIGTLVPDQLLSDGDFLLRNLERLAGGLLATALLMLGLGEVGALRSTIVLVITIGFALVGLLRLHGVRRFQRVPDGRLLRVLGGAAIAGLVVDLAAASVPPTSADALTYHLALPKLWLSDGHIYQTFWQWLGFGPDAVELLYAQGLALGGGATASVIGAAFAVLTAGAVFGLGRELGSGSQLAGAAACALFTLQGIVTWEATGAFVELATAFYTALAAWLVVRVARKRDVRDAAWAGLAAGGAAATKYPGLFVVLLTGAALTIVAVRVRRLRFLPVAGAAAAVCCGAWYLRTGLATGNPLYPFLFGGRMWTPESDRLLPALRSAYGMGTSPLRLPFLPLDLLVHGGRFDRGQYIDTALLPLVLLAPFASRRRDAVAVGVAALVLVVTWWATSPQARFLLPALALLAGVAGAALAALWERGRARTAIAAGFAVAAVWYVVPTAALTWTSVPVALGAESRPHFVQRMTGTYDALHEVGRRTRGTVAFAGYGALYYFPRDAIYLGTGEFAPDVPRGAYLSRLRDAGVEYVLAESPKGLRNLDPIRSCLRHLDGIPARFVTSRTRGTSVPIVLDLFRLKRC